MLLKSYSMEIIRPKCNPNFERLHCIAHLDQDISEVLPYLNALWGGESFSKDPPSLTIKLQGKIITLHPKEIAITAIQDKEEAEKILEWLKKEINETWEKRDQITPLYETPPKPEVIKILQFLPKTNCKKCGAPTCMVFAAQMVEGGRSVDQCPELSEENKRKLKEYLSQFPGY